MEPLFTAISIVILIISVIVHEVAHGVAAERLGDPTPRTLGRITLNPIKHVDLVGSIIVPIVLILSGSSIVFGWAKPVPFNPMNFRNKRWGDAIVAVAGPATNIVLAVIFAIIARLVFNVAPEAFLTTLVIIVSINISLAIFNLMPVPPLDGHHILRSVARPGSALSRFLSNRQPFIVSLIIVLVLWQFVAPLASVTVRALLPGM